MANITISDLALSVDSESFLTDLSELNEQDMASIMGNIIGGCCCCCCKKTTTESLVALV